MSRFKHSTYHAASHSKEKQLHVPNGTLKINLPNYKSIEESISDIKAHNFEQKDEADPKRMANYINSSIIGNSEFHQTPYGHRKIIYCDYIASGKSVDFIENFIR